MVVKTVVEAQDIFDKAWEGFNYLPDEDFGEEQSVYVDFFDYYNL